MTPLPTVKHDKVDGSVRDAASGAAALLLTLALFVALVYVARGFVGDGRTNEHTYQITHHLLVLIALLTFFR